MQLNLTNDIIPIILSSTFLTGLMTAAVTLIMNKRKNSLKYITEDRRHWRKEIREIIDELENVKNRNIQKVLSKLKVRINPYGKNENDCLKDSHIWNLIDKMEKTSENSKLIEAKNELIFYLSLLLKYDWERTKKEVSGDKNLFSLSLTFLFGLCFLVYKHFFEYGLVFNDVFIEAFFLFLLLPIIIGQGAIQTFCREEWNKGKKIKTKCLRRCGLIGSLAIAGYAFLIVLPREILNAYNFELLGIKEGKGFLDATIVMAVMIVLGILSFNLTTSNIQSQYRQQIEKYKTEKNNRNICLCTSCEKYHSTDSR